MERNASVPSAWGRTSECYLVAAVTYAFLCDENSMHLAPLLGPGRAETVVDFDMRGASDPQVLAKADEERRILVTSNREDFRELFIAYAAQGGKRKCTDLFGLILFSGEKDAQLRLPVKKIEAELRLEGRKITWCDIHHENLLVRVTAGNRPRVERLPRCPYCAAL